MLLSRSCFEQGTLEGWKSRWVQGLGLAGSLWWRSPRLLEAAFPCIPKAPLITWACGGWWTGHRMLQAGYLVSGLCACGQPDTIFHKIWQCQHTAGLRLAISPLMLQHFVKEDCSICLRALLAHPGRHISSCSSGPQWAWLGAGGGVWAAQGSHLH